MATFKKERMNYFESYELSDQKYYKHRHVTPQNTTGQIK